MNRRKHNTHPGQRPQARCEFAGDPCRPGFHFLPPRCWMNDPNGLIQWRGQYHLFYQHNPLAAVWGNMTWGHAVSDDLLHWRDLPHALEPEDDYDGDGCFSGCAVDHDGQLTLIYTGNGRDKRGAPRQVQCLAHSPDGVRFEKHPANPVIAAPPEGFHPADFRDPFVWRDGDGWAMVVGTSTDEPDERRTPAVLLYRSEDLIHWRYEGVLHHGEASLGRIWECPNFFPLDDQWVLIVSPIPLKRAIYFTGTFDGRRFTPRVQGEIDRGGSLYAPLTFADDHGRRILMGWCWEMRPQDEQQQAGWAGVQSLPRRLGLGADGRLTFAPIDEVAQLRQTHRQWQAMDLQPEPRWLKSTAGGMLELNATFRPDQQHPLGLCLGYGDRNEPAARLNWDPATGELAVEIPPREGTDAPARHADSLKQAAAEPLHLHIFLDRSILEVFANGCCCLTSRLYPPHNSPTHVGVYGGGSSRLTRADLWRMQPVWTTSSPPS